MEQIEIINLGSGSTGNCYAFRKHNEIVLVECGFEYGLICSKLILQGISPEEIKAVIITHSHKDHSMAALDFIKRNIPVYSNFINLNQVGDGQKVKLTDWLKVYCFSVEHDVPSLGFAFLDLETKMSYLFINDTGEFAFPLSLSGVMFDVVMIECNFIRVQLEAMKRSNPKARFKYERQEQYHLSLLGTKHMLSQMNIDKAKTIILMHLSMDCSNETVMKTEIESVYGIRTLIAKRNGGLN